MLAARPPYTVWGVRKKIVEARQAIAEILEPQPTHGFVTYRKNPEAEKLEAGADHVDVRWAMVRRVDHHAIDHLPISRAVRLRWLRLYIDATHGRRLQAAMRATADDDRISAIHSEFQMELPIIDDEVSRLVSERLLNQGFWLRVPVPPYLNMENAQLSEDWTKTPFTDTHVLSDAGIAKIRDLIRLER